jgi:hypothetical protein
MPGPEGLRNETDVRCVREVSRTRFIIIDSLLPDRSTRTQVQ